MPVAEITRVSWRDTVPLDFAPSSDVEDDLDWLDLVPPEVQPEGYAQTMRSAAVAQHRLDELEDEIAVLGSQLAASAADHTIPAGDLADTAVRLAALERVRAALPAVPRVPAEDHDAIIAAMTRGFHDRLAVGAPPVYAAELIHCVTQHPRDLGPLPHGNDLQVVEIFEKVAATAAEHYRTAKRLTEPLQGRMGDRVRAIHAFADQLAEHDRLVASLRELVTATDTERLKSIRVHRCPQLAGRTVRLEPIPVGVPWSRHWALQGNGRPPVAGPAATP